MRKGGAAPGQRERDREFPIHAQAALRLRILLRIASVPLRLARISSSMVGAPGSGAPGEHLTVVDRARWLLPG